jgi:serine/threonine-protein kinase RsbW
MNERRRWSQPSDLTLALDGSQLAVRDGLDRVLADPVLAALSEDARGTLWTVLAEVLNNIVEHAYAGGSGPILLCLRRLGPKLAVEILDSGNAMPGLRLPEGKAAEIGAFDDLPEGGFGWFLIRTMTDGLEYDRIGAENRLRFSMTCD